MKHRPAKISDAGRQINEEDQALGLILTSFMGPGAEWQLFAIAKGYSGHDGNGSGVRRMRSVMLPKVAALIILFPLSDAC